MLQSLKARFLEILRRAAKEEGGLQCLPQVLELHQDDLTTGCGHNVDQFVVCSAWESCRTTQSGGKGFGKIFCPSRAC